MNYTLYQNNNRIHHPTRTLNSATGGRKTLFLPGKT